MKNVYDSRQWFKYIFILIGILIVIASGFISDRLVKDMAREERKNMEIWVKATRNLASEELGDFDMYLFIAERNTSIPIIQVKKDSQQQDSIVFSRNIDLPEGNTTAFLQKKLQAFKAKNPPIVSEDSLSDTLQYYYYDDSNILKRLSVFPFAQLAVIFAFILVAFLAFTSTKKAEQNKVWVGLSKETAHQLGTPISSLVAWLEYLKTKSVDASYLSEMEKDVHRLETIAERFSKIGSNPDPVPLDLNQSIRNTCDYMSKRISSKVKMNILLPEEPMLVLMNDSLFGWVVENLVKNAVDAMDGKGAITIQAESKGKVIRIDVADTGKGIPKSRYNTIFSPGYTTKARGWGLGLSLVKRIIESYKGGKIFVKNSELGKGTTFRIELRKYTNLRQETKKI